MCAGHLDYTNCFPSLRPGVVWRHHPTNHCMQEFQNRNPLVLRTLKTRVELHILLLFLNVSQMCTGRYVGLEMRLRKTNQKIRLSTINPIRCGGLETLSGAGGGRQTPPLPFEALVVLFDRKMVPNLISRRD